MGINEIRALKNAAYEPKIEKARKGIAAISEKKKARMVQDKELLLADKEFYLQVWQASPHVCFCGCGRKLGKEPLTILFHHLLEKSKYPQLRHVPENIVLLAPECHTAYHTKASSRPKIVERRIEAEKLLLK